MVLRRGLVLSFVCTALISLSLPALMVFAGDAAAGPKDDNSADGEAAFNSTKELGTAEAWNAFLANYPTGFHADLARAYLKKLTAGPAAASTAPQAAGGNAEELSCADRNTVHSVNSDVPTKITFVNSSGMYRSIQWIDFKGGVKDYGGLDAGARLTLDTFVTHPWMISTGPGDCLQIFMPASVPATVELVRLAADGRPQTEPAAQRKPTEYEPKKKQTYREPEKQEQKKKPLVCGKNYKLSKGECVLQQNCGSNAYRSPEGDCYCTKNYTMKNGKCQWKQDKQGFEVAPWKKTGCKSWQAQCSQGNNKACGQYEANCQVN